jgi:hypothetical protein
MINQLDSTFKAFTIAAETITSQLKEMNHHLKRLDILNDYVTKVKEHDKRIEKLEALEIRV